jgi:crotonobetaine/carnitine-CoA ligase
MRDQHAAGGATTIVGLLQHQRAEGGDRVFAVFPATGRSLTFAQLDDLSGRAARGLRAAGIGVGEAVAVHLQNGEEFLIAWWAIAKAGAVMVPTNLELAPPELAYQVRAANVVAAITSADHAARFAGAGVPTTFLVGDTGPSSWAALLEPAEPQVPLDAASSATLAQILFTSGSTSRPKGAMITHELLVFAAREWARRYGLSPNDRFLVNLPMYHLTGLTPCLAAMALGGSVVVVPRFSASAWLPTVRAHDVTVATLVGTTLRMVLAQPETSHDVDHALRQVIYAINVPIGEWNRFEDRFGVPLVNGYGMTEAYGSVIVAPARGERRIPSIGRASPIRPVRIIRPDGTDAAPGEIGEIVIKGELGKTFFAGYFGQPEATAEVWRDGWYHSGDFGVADEAGWHWFVDRRTDMIKTSGENVSASEVETVLRQHPMVADAAVIGAPDPVRDQVVVAFVVPADGALIDIDDVGAFCAERLASFKRPVVIEVRRSLPTNEAGKVMRKQLRDERSENSST